MKILVYGAGVLGSLYGARLYEAGHDVTLLARGQRLIDVREHGVVLEDVQTHVRTTTRIPVVDALAPETAYDLVLVVVRKSQLETVLPTLAANRATPNVLFLLNNAAGPDQLVEALGFDRVLLGFPGAGGERVGHVVRYVTTAGKVQATTIGEPEGRISPRITAIAEALNSAGFPVTISRNMDAWLKTHVALVSPIANALYMVGGDIYRLARTRDALLLIVRGIREGLQVLRALEIPITPPVYRWITRLPEPVLVRWLQRVFAQERAELAIQRHANVARDEMAVLAEEFRVLAERSGVRTPVLDILRQHLEPDAEPMRDRSAEVPLDRRSLGWSLIALGGVALLAWLLCRRKER
ncbi:MAG: ketopantoate reductase family protein [Anaerolineales bacterium]